MDFLTSLLELSSITWISALILGLMTAISPCPMATNITAVGFISRDIENRRKVFLNGVFYTLGRGITYFTLGVLFYFGAATFRLSGFFQQYGEKMVGPLLILIGLFMLDLIKFSFPGFSSLSQKMEAKKVWGFWDALILGIVFALAFCPYSGVLFFGMLIPMTIASPSGLTLPLIFALATGLPVLIFAWLLAFSVGYLGGVYNKLKSFEFWFRKAIAILFIGIGLYYSRLFFI